MNIKKLLNLCLLLAIFSAFVGVGVLSDPQPVMAQTDDNYIVDEYEFDEEELEQALEEWEKGINDPEWQEEAAKVGVLGLVTSLFSSILSLVIGIAVYVFTSYTIYVIANKLGYKENAWMAFVPIANVVLVFQMAEMNPLYLLFILIPCVGWLILLVFMVQAWMKLAEKLGFPSWLGVLAIFYPISLFVLGYLAWGEPTEKES